MNVIGFLSYEDFIAELETNPPDVVRLQDYYRRSSTDNGLVSVRFLIEAAVVQDGQLIVARFDIGGGLALEDDNRRRDQSNSNVALMLLKDDLARRGFTVRPGVVAAVRESETTATCELWRFQDGMLVANESEAA